MGHGSKKKKNTRVPPHVIAVMINEEDHRIWLVHIFWNAENPQPIFAWMIVRYEFYKYVAQKLLIAESYQADKISGYVWERSGNQATSYSQWEQERTRRGGVKKKRPKKTTITDEIPKTEKRWNEMIPLILKLHFSVHEYHIILYVTLCFWQLTGEGKAWPCWSVAHRTTTTTWKVRSCSVLPILCVCSEMWSRKPGLWCSFPSSVSWERWPAARSRRHQGGRSCTRSWLRAPAPLYSTPSTKTHIWKTMLMLRYWKNVVSVIH